MLINFQQLKNLPVETESGGDLGRVVDLEINTDGHNVRKYLVGAKRFLKNNADYLISPEQIVKVTAEKIIVQDNLQKQEAEVAQRSPLQVEKPAALNIEIETR